MCSTVEIETHKHARYPVQPSAIVKFNYFIADCKVSNDLQHERKLLFFVAREVVL